MIEKQLLLLSQRITLEEVFASLIEPLNIFLRNSKDGDAFHSLDLSGLLTQIDSTRQALNACEAGNPAVLISWILERARDRKLLNGKVRNGR